MLPFLKNSNKEGAASGPVQHLELENPHKDQEEEQLDYLAIATHDIFQAIEQRNLKQLKEALMAFVQMCDEMPHSEGEHNGELFDY